MQPKFGGLGSCNRNLTVDCRQFHVGCSGSDRSRNLSSGLGLIAQYEIRCLNISVDKRCGQLE